MTDDGFSHVDPGSTPDNVRGKNTFVVRIWNLGAPDQVRGHVQHVRSRQSAYFATRQRLLTFIEEQLRMAGTATPGTGPARTRRRSARDSQSSP